MDFGTGSFEERIESTVHSTTDSSPVFDLFNGELEVEFTTESYDLGLVDESELDSVVEKHQERSIIHSWLWMGCGIHYSPFVVELVWAWLVLFFIAPTVVTLYPELESTNHSYCDTSVLEYLRLGIGLSSSGPHSVLVLLRPNLLPR